MTEVSRILRNILFPKIPPIFKFEVGFFSDRKTFAQNDFPGKFYYFGTNYERSFKKIKETFFIPKTPDFSTLSGFFSNLKNRNPKLSKIGKFYYFGTNFE